MARRTFVLIALASAAAACEVLAPIDPVAGGGDGAPTGEAGAGRVWRVGPTRAYTLLSQVAPQLAPGDRVEVDGDATYTDDVSFTLPGAKGAPITIVGLPVNGRRPRLVGNQTTVHLNAPHYVFQGFDVSGGNFACILHQSDDVTIRDAIVHDCPRHGILGADVGSGSLVVEYVEAYACDTAVDVATDQDRYPGSVFRMQQCYVHAAPGAPTPDGGASESIGVVSRAERTELYGNWFEGARFHEVTLVGPDGRPARARMDADVVGNVFFKRSTFHAVRLGDDGTGPTKGRYRFVANTFVFDPATTGAAIHVTGAIESLEVHDSAFVRAGGGDVFVVDDGEAIWATGAPLRAGQANWIPRGSTGVPSEWTGTITGDDPGMVDVAGHRPWPAAGSALIDRGVLPTVGVPGHELPSPLAAPLFVPPRAALPAVGQAEPRVIVGPIDVGAYERTN